MKARNDQRRGDGLRMTIRSVLTCVLCCLLAACGRQDVLRQAEADFQARNPRWRIVETALAENGARQARVLIRYVSSSPAAYPATAPVREMEMTYQKNGQTWMLSGEEGSRYVGPWRE